MTNFHRNKDKRLVGNGNKVATSIVRGNEKSLKKGDQTQSMTRWVPKLNDRRSYANVVKLGSALSTELSSVKGASIGNGCLLRSAVASLWDHRSSEYLIDFYMKDGEDNATIRGIGNKQ
ncbi:hypothetical protein Dimus_003681, partial [Dionaea muscipula]